MDLRNYRDEGPLIRLHLGNPSLKCSPLNFESKVARHRRDLIYEFNPSIHSKPPGRLVLAIELPATPLIDLRTRSGLVELVSDGGFVCRWALVVNLIELAKDHRILSVISHSVAPFPARNDGATSLICGLRCVILSPT